MAYDKLSIINDCLIATGNDPVASEDGSDAWVTASSAYDRYLPIVLYSHNWSFQTGLQNLTRVGDSTVPGYSDAFAKPADCLHLENVWRTDWGGYVPQSSSFSISGEGARVPALDYDIIGDQIHCVAPAGATAKYVKRPPGNDPAAWPEGFVEALRLKVESLIYRALNEDMDSALKVGAVGKNELDEARARVDQEKPRRVALRSRMLERRRTRNIGGVW